jgi:hypothetical protein
MSEDGSAETETMLELLKVAEGAQRAADRLEGVASNSNRRVGPPSLVGLERPHTCIQDPRGQIATNRPRVLGTERKSRHVRPSPRPGLAPIPRTLTGSPAGLAGGGPL